MNKPEIEKLIQLVKRDGSLENFQKKAFLLNHLTSIGKPVEKAKKAVENILSVDKSHEKIIAELQSFL